ncbi:MAG TPA: hypothetical protein GX731_00725 [Clostridiales bacterium]|nr:hypothetical protein [Clostridiales bacterium]
MNSKKIILMMISIIIVTLLSGCSITEDISFIERDNEEHIEVKEPVSDEIETAVKLYSEVLDTYYTALHEKWNFQTLSYASLSILSTYCYEGDPLTNVGYEFIDIDNNGVLELLIGSLNGDPFVDKMIFDIYTIVDDQPALVFTGWERNRYYLCEDYSIANEGSSGASSSFYGIYNLDYTGYKLVLTEAVIYYEEYQGNDPPWYYTTDKDGDISNDMSITEEEAYDKLSEYKNMHKQVDLIPFAIYQ